MSASRSEQILEVLGDPLARDVLRCLLSESATQGELVSRLGCAQAGLSRAVKVLRLTGLVTVNGRRNASLELKNRPQLVALLLAADRLAEVSLADDLSAQEAASRDTRGAAIRPTPEPAAKGAAR